ncbi:MAG: menaquinone biosynthetic enzyme MqnA/MqnD family protein [Desulfomonilaceae bacterium]
MEIGYIDYLNCYPFYYKMFEKEPLEGVRVVPALPAQLNQMVRDKALDLSPISAATYAAVKDDVYLLPQFCLSSVGYVGSVLLCSNLPIEQLDGKKIGMSSASHTSRVLLRVLMKKFFNVQPCYVSSRPYEDLIEYDAALIIGNDAMTDKVDSVPYKYDLGELWLQKTGFPIVFAVFVVRRQTVRQNPSGVKAVINSYASSIGLLSQEKGKIIIKAKEKYPNIFYDVDSYYDTLQFEFADNLKEAFRYYLSLAEEAELLGQVKSLEFLDDKF